MIYLLFLIKNNNLLLFNLYKFFYYLKIYNTKKNYIILIHKLNNNKIYKNK